MFALSEVIDTEFFTEVPHGRRKDTAPPERLAARIETQVIVQECERQHNDDSLQDCKRGTYEIYLGLDSQPTMPCDLRF